MIPILYKARELGIKNLQEYLDQLELTELVNIVVAINQRDPRNEKTFWSMAQTISILEGYDEEHQFKSEETSKLTANLMTAILAFNEIQKGLLNTSNPNWMLTNPETMTFGISDIGKIAMDPFFKGKHLTIIKNY